MQTCPTHGYFRWALAFLLLGGCCSPVPEHVDFAVDNVANHVLDLQPADAAVPRGRTRLDEPKGLEVGPRGDGRRRPLVIPPAIPGTEAPDIHFPDPRDPRAEEKRQQALRDLYPGLPPLGPDPEIHPGLDGHPLTLADLQRLAFANSPLIRQAAADVEAARGTARQAGAYPNPTMGYEADNINTGGTAGYQGAFIDQLIKTAGKLRLTQAAGQIDLANAQLAFRRAQTDLTTQVRSQYFAVLVALEGMHINRALVEFADKLFSIQVDQVAGGPAAPYEPMALRVLAYQARVNLVQARNRYTSAWKQLAANLGLPGLPPTQLAGRADLRIPVYHFDKVLARALSVHTDVLTADNAVRRARFTLRLAQVTPIPDVDVRVAVQKDFTTPPFLVTQNVQVSVPVPIWDQNRGAIAQAQGQLVRAIEEGHRVRDALTITLTQAFESYENNRKILAYYRDRILPDQVRVFKETYERHRELPADVGFADVVAAQQTLATVLATYLNTLGLTWQAITDVANVMQTNDLFQIGGEVVESECLVPLERLDQLPALPCCHPSSPLQDPRLKGAAGGWPEAIRELPSGRVPKMPRIENGEEQTKGGTSMNRPGEATGTAGAGQEVDLLGSSALGGDREGDRTVTRGKGR